MIVFVTTEEIVRFGEGVCLKEMVGCFVSESRLWKRVLSSTLTKISDVRPLPFNLASRLSTHAVNGPQREAEKTTRLGLDTLELDVTTNGRP
jgi:hypothetical protein